MAADLPEPDMTAAELALGVLDGEERAQAMRRVLAEPAFAREVAYWHDRLAALFAWWPGVAPPPQVEERVMASVSAAPAAAAPSPVWRAVALAMTLVAAALLAVVALRPSLERRPVPAPQPSVPSLRPALAAAIAPEGDTPPVPVVYDPASATLRIAVADRLAPAQRSPQLWVLDKAGTPYPLAVLANGRAMTVEIPVTLRATVAAGAVLAISIEPRGGAPGNTPTGPVVATGALNRL